MVRDDFWLAASRFMRDLEIRLVEGENSALVDLFDPRHARKVLMAFGRAYGALPENVADLGRDQEPFLDQAISGLAQDGKIISVRLALFAEMIKGKPWTSATLEEVGGTEGMGLTFLEETFSVSTAPPEHRLHQKAAQAVLKALLPETGTEIKGQMRSRQELLAASGYATRPKDFDDVIRILDSEIRLITPTDPEGVAGDEWGVEGESSGNRPGTADGAVNPATRRSPPTTRYYQLTHDYLVHSLREWLTRKQKESRRGRAELMLADRAAVWNARPENRQLPSLLQWFTIRWQTRKKTWTPPQKKMMAKAGRYRAVRGLVLAVVLALVGWGGYEGHGTLKAHALRDRLLDANTNEVPTIVEDMGSYRRWINSLLHEAFGKAERDKDSRKQLHAGLALLPVDPSQVRYLYDRLLDAEPHEVPVIRDALAPHKDELLEKLWEVVEKPKKGKESQRLRAAAALAKYDPESESWAQASGPVVEQLVGENPVFLGLWMEGFRPIKGKLLASLEGIYRNPNSRESERTLATNILADYAAQQPEVLADLLMDADEKQFPVIYAKFKDRGEQGVPLLTAVIDTKLPADLPSSDDKRETLAKRQGNAAMALLRMDQPAKVWPLLKHSPDPRVRSYLINRLGPLGADAQAIIKRLDEEPDISARRALLLSLGEVSETEFTPDARKAMLPKLQEIYRTESDPGLHAASEWLLRTWKQVAWLKQVNDEWAKDKVKGEGWWVVGKDKDSPPATRHSPPTTPKWYVNTQGQTMVVIPGPVEFLMGSPTTEKNRGRFEPQHKKRIGRTFALAATSVTKEQFLRFQPKFWGNQMMRYPEPTCPIGGVNWYEAAAYCNWLSKDEGISEEQWCYEIKGPETKLKEKYLSLTGYRLPTEAEMEYAIRAGALTSRYYGETEELLPKYAWYVKNSQERTWPVGSLKANDLGLFDVYGNLITWCQERYKEYPAGKGDQAVEDQEDGLVVKDTDSRVLRGGTFVMQASAARSANRNNAAMPTFGNYAIGFRPARTLPLSSFTALPPTAAGGRK